MQLININLENINNIKLPNSVATIGQFDGLHIGHMSLINKCLEIKNKNNLKTVLITFNPRVDVIVKNDSNNNYLLDTSSFINKLKTLNIDYLLIIEFNKEIASITHKDFFNKLLAPLNIKELVIGFDFSYGYKGLGTPNSIFEDSNFSIKPIIIEEQTINNKKIGSIQIKELLKKGNIKEANNLLGYNFFLNLKKESDYYTSLNIDLLNNQEYIILYKDKKYKVQKTTNKLFIKDFIYDPNINTIQFIQ